MRIAVAGKGGSGKTTIAATMARLFARRGYTVNAIDDDPNPNLSTALGLAPDLASALRRAPREEILDEVAGEHGEAVLRLKRPFPEVLAEYGAHGPDGVHVLTMTGLLGAGKGWLCGQHATVRGLIAELGTLQPDDITVLDMEASIEHLSRGTLRNVDTLLLVTEPYYRSLETLGRMAPLAAELGLARRPVIANKVRTDRDLAAIGEYCARLGLDLIGSVPFDETVTEADHQGRSLIDHAPATAAVLAIDQIVGELLNAQPAAAPK